MAFGITSQGFVRQTFAELLTEWQTYYRERLSKKINLFDPNKSITQLVTPLADSDAALWELAELTYNSYDPDNATAASALIIGKLAGMAQRGATKGRVQLLCSLEEGRIYAANSLIVNVTNQPNNRWRNLAAVDTTAAAVTDDYLVTFEAETAGKFLAPSGTLTVISAPVTGFFDAANALDADAGTDIETPEELMVRRTAELGAAGVNTILAIRYFVLQVPGVEQCQVFSNRSSEPVDGIPANSIRVVIYDGTPAGADVNLVAQAIQDSKVDGIRSFGLVSGLTTDANGAPATQSFDRTQNRRIYVAATLTGTYSPDAAKQAMKDYVTGIIGASVNYFQLAATVLSVPGVTGIVSLTVGTSPAPVGTSNITVQLDERASLDTSDIALT